MKKIFLMTVSCLSLFILSHCGSLHPSGGDSEALSTPTADCYAKAKYLHSGYSKKSFKICSLANDGKILTCDKKIGMFWSGSVTEICGPNQYCAGSGALGYATPVCLNKTGPL